MLKFIPEEISSVLAKIFNMSIALGSFPIQWKAATVTAVYKKGNRSDINNYRPIWILPLVAKIFERAVNRQLRIFLESHKLLSQHQHGFRKLHSCQSALISLTDTLFINRNDKKLSIIASLDYSKAFDTLDHKILLNKLAALNMSESALSWFTSYLANRRQCVKYNAVLSDYEQIEFGVPQGSVVGPTMFIIYVNDLLLSLPDGCAIAYADDITITASGSKLDIAVSRLQDLLSVVHCWSEHNALYLNTLKCFVMHIRPSLRGYQAQNINIHLGSHALTKVQKLSLLGVIISDDLSWTCQSRRVRAKMTSRMAAFKRFGRCLNVNTRLIAYNAFIKPHLDYCLPVWGNTCTSVASELDRTLARCLRTISGSHTSTFSRASLETYGICDFTTHVFMSNVLAIHKQLHLPTEHRAFNPCLLTASHDTRASQSNKLVLQCIKRTNDHYCFSVTGPSHWNSLPNSVTAANSSSSFKNKLLTFIASKLS